MSASGYNRPTAIEDRPRHCLIYLHGGGFVAGSLDQFDADATRVAAEAEVLVVSVDYRLAPETPFPAHSKTATPRSNGLHDKRSSWASIHAGWPLAAKAPAVDWAGSTGRCRPTTTYPSGIERLPNSAGIATSAATPEAERTCRPILPRRAQRTSQAYRRPLFPHASSTHSAMKTSHTYSVWRWPEFRPSSCSIPVPSTRQTSCRTQPSANGSTPM
ncbi:MAG: hypothetical protein EOP32_17130 [Rhodococcus sp. (in: high G+C Gram-positive bacteria)]|nr:MAG: hypothetical protein EOP32_17130 [Rhodococcus sp. (in: high G+C Gram-positive bacteria)]